MTFAAIAELILGVLKFPTTILEFIRVLKKTPAEQHAGLIEKIKKEETEFQDTGRPDWG